MDIPNSVLATLTLDKASRERGIALQKIAAAIQYTVYGVPSVFYGDEVGLEGYHDPFCRRTYPWGRECEELLGFYRTLGRIREQSKLFADGGFRVEYAEEAVIAYSRYDDNEKITVVANASDTAATVDGVELVGKTDMLTGEIFGGIIPPCTALILR